MDEATAYHETGHALIAELVGRSVIEIGPDRDGKIRCQYEDKRAELDSCEWFRRCVHSGVAGEIAECHFNPDYDWRSSGRDDMTVSLYFDYLEDDGCFVETSYESHPRRLYKDAVKEAVEIMIRQEWPVIELIAGVMQSEGVLEGENLRKLMDNSGLNCGTWVGVPITDK